MNIKIKSFCFTAAGHRRSRRAFRACAIDDPRTTIAGDATASFA
jgi:hypothetical protein